MGYAAGNRNRALGAVELLEAAYADLGLTLRWENPLELLVATILSAQSTDIQVNRVTQRLFQRYHTAADYAEADLGRLEEEIRGVGYHRQKARHIKEACRLILKEFGGEVPRTMKELLRLPGVGRKTANIVLNRAFGVVEGIAVDTHVFRVSRRLGLSSSHTPAQVEQDLMALLPKEKWGRINRLFIAHGRRICRARQPLCHICPVKKLCPSASLQSGKREKKQGSGRQV